MAAQEQAVGVLRHNDGIHQRNEAAIVESNATLRAQNNELREMLIAAEAANTQSKTQVATVKDESSVLKERNAALDQQYRDQITKFNNAVLLMRVALTVVESLSTGDGVQPRATRALFAKTYDDEVKAGIEGGFIPGPLHTDPFFASTSPKTQSRLLDMLRRVAHDKANPLVELKPVVLQRAVPTEAPSEAEQADVPPKRYGSPQPAPRRLVAPKVERTQEADHSRSQCVVPPAAPAEADPAYVPPKHYGSPQPAPRPRGPK